MPTSLLRPITDPDRLAEIEAEKARGPISQTATKGPNRFLQPITDPDRLALIEQEALRQPQAPHTTPDDQPEQEGGRGFVRNTVDFLTYNPVRDWAIGREGHSELGDSVMRGIIQHVIPGLGSLPELANEAMFEEVATQQHRRHSRDKLRQALRDEQAVPNPYDILATVSFTSGLRPGDRPENLEGHYAAIDQMRQRAGGQPPERDPRVAAAQEDLLRLQEDATALSDNPDRLRELAEIVTGPEAAHLRLQPQTRRTLMDLGHARREAGMPEQADLSHLQDPEETPFLARFSLQGARPQFDPSGMAAGLSMWSEAKVAELGIERDKSMERPYTEILESDGVPGVSRRAAIDFFEGAPNYAMQILVARGMAGATLNVGRGAAGASLAIAVPSAGMDYGEAKAHHKMVSDTVQTLLAEGATEQEITAQLAEMGIQMPGRDVALQQAMLNMGPIATINMIPWLGFGSKYMPPNWRGAAGVALIHGTSEAGIEGVLDPSVRVITQRIMDGADAETAAERDSLFGELGAAVTEGINAAPGAFLLGLMGGATSPAQMRLQQTNRLLRDAERSFREGRQSEADKIIDGLVSDGDLSAEQADMYRAVFETPLTTDDVVDRAALPSTDDMAPATTDPELRVTTPEDRAQQESRIQDDIVHDAEERVAEREGRQASGDRGIPEQVNPKAAAFRPDIMQYKRSDHDPKKGLNKKDLLEGAWDPAKAGNLILWQPTDPQAYGLAEGEQYIVANGHHRLDFAQRSEADFVNALIFREADGYTESDMRRMGAETNIAEGKGTRHDQVRFLREVQAQQNRAAAEQMLGRIGKGGVEAGAIALDASESLHNAFLNEQVTDAQAAKIAMAVPLDRREGGALDATDAAQRAALTYVVQRGKTKVSGDEAAQFARSALHDITIGRLPDTASLQDELFGQSPEWQTFQAVSEAKAAIVNETLGDLKSRLGLIRRATDLMMRNQNPQAKKILKDAGITIDVQDVNGLLREGKRLSEEIVRWGVWNTDPARTAQVERQLRERHPDLVQNDTAPSTPNDPVATHAALTDMMTQEGSEWLRDTRDSGQPVTPDAFEAYFAQKYPDLRTSDPQAFLSALDAAWAALNVESVQTGQGELFVPQDATQEPVGALEQPGAAPQAPPADEGPTPSQQMAQEFGDSADQSVQSGIDQAKDAIGRGVGIDSYLTRAIEQAVGDALADPLSDSGRAVIDQEQVITDAALKALHDYTRAMQDLGMPIPQDFTQQVDGALRNAIGGVLGTTRQSLQDAITEQARAMDLLQDTQAREGASPAEVESAETQAAEASVKAEVNRRIAEEADRVAPERGELDPYDRMSRGQLQRTAQDRGIELVSDDTNADIINLLREWDSAHPRMEAEQIEAAIAKRAEALEENRFLLAETQAELDQELVDDPGSETARILQEQADEFSDAISTIQSEIAALQAQLDRAGEAESAPSRRLSADDTGVARTARAAQMALQDGPLTVDQLGETLDTDQSLVEQAVNRLVERGEATLEDGLVSLTEAGEANAVVVADETANSPEATLAGQLDQMNLQQLTQLAERQGMSVQEIADAVMPHQRNQEITPEERDTRSERSLRDALRQRLGDRAALPQSGEALLDVNDPKTLDSRTEKPPEADTSRAGLTPKDGVLSNRRDNIISYATNHLGWTRAPADQQTSKRAVKMLGPKNETYWIVEGGQVRVGRTLTDSKPVGQATQQQFDAHSIIEGQHTERAARVASQLIEQNGGKVPNGVRIVDRPDFDRNGWHIWDRKTGRTRKIMLNASRMVLETRGGQITVRPDQIRATLAHEYGHAAFKRAKALNPELFAQINSLYDGLSEAQQAAIRNEIEQVYSDRPTEVQREEMIVTIMERIATYDPSAMDPNAKDSLFVRVRKALQKALSEMFGVGQMIDMTAVTRAAMAEALAELQGVETRDVVSETQDTVVESIESGKEGGDPRGVQAERQGRADRGVAGENDPQTVAQLNALKDDPNSPVVSQESWQDVPGSPGYQIRQGVNKAGEPVQQIKSPQGSLITRALDSRGRPYAEVEGDAQSAGEMLRNAESEFARIFEVMGLTQERQAQPTTEGGDPRGVQAERQGRAEEVGRASTVEGVGTNEPQGRTGDPEPGRADAGPVRAVGPGGKHPAGVRPPLRVAEQDRIPEARRIVDSESYNNGLDEQQQLGVNLALQRFESGGKGFMLADGTGVGKTRQLLAVADQYKKRTGKPVLIVTQNQQIIKGSFTSDAQAMGVSLSDFDVATYSELGSGKAGKGQYGLVIFDEAHNLKNANTNQSVAANAVKRDSTLFATATPMDRVSAAVYFLSEVTGQEPDAIYSSLGMRVSNVFDERTRRTRKEVQILPGFEWDDVVANLLAARNSAIESGAMIRREYPFFGDIDGTQRRLESKAVREQEMIDDYWQGRIEEARSPNARRNLAGQRIQELSRWTEPQKFEAVMDRVDSELKAGRQVIVIAEGVNETEIKSIGKKVPGLITMLSEALEARGERVAKIFGTGDKSAQVDLFQSGRAKVALATPKSGGTGINLDDSVGNAPRTMIIATANFSGDVFDQIQGRVSRRNTKSPARIQNVTLDGSISDARRGQILQKKLQALRAIQSGVDLDLAVGVEAEGVVDPRLEVDEMRSRGGIALTANFNSILKPWVDRYHAHQAQFDRTGIQDTHADVSRSDPDAKGMRAIPHHIWNQFAKRFYERWLRNTGDLPAYVFDQKRVRDNRLVNTMMEVMLTNSDLEQAMKAEYGSRLQKHHLQLVNTALGNSDPDLMAAAEQALPESVRDRVKRMRDQVDSLSIRMIQEGIAQGRMRATFEANLGSYIHRSYKVFNEPGYVRRMIRYRDQDGSEYHRVWNRAVDWAQNNWEDASGHSYAINPDDPQEVKDRKRAQVEGILKDRLEAFLEDGRFLGWLKRHSSLRTDKSVMKKRHDDTTLPAPIRELYGEVTDPFLNYSRTIQKMSQVLFNEQMLRNIAQQGTASSATRDTSIGQPFFIDPDPMVQNDPEMLNTHYRRINDPRMGPLNGLATTPEIYAALQNIYDDRFFGLFDRQNWLVSGIARAQGLTKLNLTVMNASTHPRNYMGAAQFALMQGHFWSAGNPGHMMDTVKRAHKLAWAEFLAKPEGEQAQALAKLRELGVLGQNVFVRDFQDLMRVGRGVDEPTDIMQSFNTASVYMSAIGEWVKAEGQRQTGIDFNAVKRKLNPSDRKLVDAMPDAFRQKVESMSRSMTPTNIAHTAMALYAFEDNVWKVFGYFNEQARVQRMHPEWNQDQLNEEAARIVRATFQNYGELSPLVQGIRRFGQIGTFIAFEAEVARTTFNTLKIATKEMASGNPEAMKIGASRLIGLAVTANLHYMAYGIAKFLGSAVMGPIGRALGYFGEDEETDFNLDDQNARRWFQPEFWRNSAQATWWKDDEGNQLWTDLGFILINGTYMRPVQAFLNGKDWIPAMQDAWWASVGPVTNRDPFMSEFAKVYADLMETDRQQWNTLDPRAGFFENSTNIVSLLAQRSLVPGTFNQAGRRIGEMREAGQDAAREGDSVLHAIGPTVARSLANVSGFDVRAFNVEQDAVRSRLVRQFGSDRRDAASGFARFANSREGEFATPEQAVQAYEQSAAIMLQGHLHAHESFLRIRDMGFPERKALQIMKDLNISERDRQMIRSGRVVAWRPSDEQLQKIPIEARRAIIARYRELNRAYAHEFGPDPVQ